MHVEAAWRADSSVPLIADTDPPELTLVGEAELSVQQECGRSFQMISDSCLADSFSDPGATAQDAVSGDVTGSITVDRTVDLTTAGVQQLTYTARDEAGQTASIVRVVTVVGVGCMDSTCVVAFVVALLSLCVFLPCHFSIPLLVCWLSRCVLRAQHVQLRLRSDRPRQRPVCSVFVRLHRHHGSQLRCCCKQWPL